MPKEAKKSTRINCPLCGNESLDVTCTGERTLYHCKYGCDQASLWQTISGQKSDYEPTRYVEKPKNNASSDYAVKLWQNSLYATSTLVETYLNSRGILIELPSSIRFLLRHKHTNTGTYWPVMYAGVTDYNGNLKAGHRTYLAADGNGKAPVDTAKKSLGCIDGHSVHLSKAGEKLAISEGIETGLSVLQATGISTWAALSAGGIEKLILPPLPLASEIIICADNDANGRGHEAAENAAIRWVAEGRNVKITMPPKVGQDFNDYFNSEVAA